MRLALLLDTCNNQRVPGNRQAQNHFKGPAFVPMVHLVDDHLSVSTGQTKPLKVLHLLSHQLFDRARLWHVAELNRHGDWIHVRILVHAGLPFGEFYPSFHCLHLSPAFLPRPFDIITKPQYFEGRPGRPIMAFQTPVVSSSNY